MVGPLCHECRASFVAAGRVSRLGISIVSAYRHESSARRLVHLLKYQGIEQAARALAPAMAAGMPVDTAALVPVPRAWLRRARFGIDPALALAQSVSQLTGIPVVSGLHPRLWWPAHAGRDRGARQPPRFTRIGDVPTKSLLVDDVVTTGVTLATAARLLGVDGAITATRADG